ncbi:MAG: serine acetyltransferase [Bacteroidales bacterium]|nr:serine acetyltransferase [Bacteroidales bacterium]
MTQAFPTRTQLHDIFDALRGHFFPEIYGATVTQEDVGKLLLPFLPEPALKEFLRELPEIAGLLRTDAQALLDNDPAVGDHREIVLCYPGFEAMLFYRVAHSLHRLGVPILPRMISETAHSATGIDIHPAAQIGAYFGIDHGTGVVIGATAIIGSHVMIYQGVTLGAKNFKYDENGRPLNIRRHPILEDNVTVYSNASILGPVRIGEGAVIGGNVWLTEDVPPGTRVLQGRFTTSAHFTDGAGI